jgi:hypothetical protein
VKTTTRCGKDDADGAAQGDVARRSRGKAQGSCVRSQEVGGSHPGETVG